MAQILVLRAASKPEVVIAKQQQEVPCPIA
jgi:hypothetical protein